MPPTETMASALGGAKVLGKGAADPSRLAAAIERGLPEASLEHVRALLHLTTAETAALLGMSEKTVTRLRRTPRATLSAVASDRLYRLARVFALVRDLYTKDESASRWLRSPQFGLGGRVPLDLLKTEIGTAEVEQLIGRIENGILS